METSSLQSLLQRMSSQALPPVVVTYCGSTSKCQQQFRRVQLYDTIRETPRMFFTIGCTMLSDAQLVQADIHLEKEALDVLHFWKIHTTALIAEVTGTIGEICILDLADDGSLYIGSSTQREMEYANALIEQGSPLVLRFWSQEQDQVKRVLRDKI